MQDDLHPPHAGPTVMLFIILGMLAGGALRQLHKKTKFPYTPMLLILGLILGYYRKYLGVIGQSTQIIQKLNPHMILFIFIPVLMFESAFNCNWFVFKKSLVNILILSIPGVLWGTLILGFCLKGVLFYSSQSLTWTQALALGSILSATDPTAIIALLKQLGSSVQFNTLIEGESLINSGTSMVLFIIFMDVIKNDTVTFISSVFNFTWLSLGGSLLGLIVGILLSRWLKRIFYDNILITNLTFAACYLAFFLAEFTWLKVSGILSVVALGLYMSAVEKTTIFSESEQALHSAWGFIQYICETIIFLLTGVIIGVEIIERNSIYTSDWVRLFIFWFLMNGARFAMVATFYPLLKMFGYGMNKKQFVVTVFGGMKGSISLCLALIVMIDPQLRERFRNLTIFYASGMTMLTVLVNGLTCSRFLNYIEMVVISPIKSKLLKLCLRKIEKQCLEKIEDFKVDRFTLLADWKKVEPLAGWEQKAKNENRAGTSNNNVTTLEIQLLNRSSLLEGFNRYEIDEETRFRLLRFIKTSFYSCFDRGECSAESVTVLSNTIDILIDNVENVEEKINLWDILVKHFTFFDIKYWMKIKDYYLIGKVSERVILNRVCFVHDVCSTLIAGCHEGISLFLKSSPIRKEYMKVVIDEVEDSLGLAQEYLSQLQHNYQSLFVNVHTMKVAVNILSFKRKQLFDMKQKGFIDQNQFDDTKGIITNQLIEMKTKTEIRWDKLTFQQILLECPMFAGLDSTQFKNLKMSAQQKQFRLGQTIQLKNSNLTLVYIIVEGIVQETYPDYKVMRSIGGMLSLYSVTSGNISLCTIRAHTPCVLLCVQLNTFRKIMKESREIETKVYKGCFADAVKNDRNNPMSLYPDIKLKRLANRAMVVHLLCQQSVQLPFGGYVFMGKICLKSAQRSIVSYESVSEAALDQSLYLFHSFIRPGLSITALTPTILLLFKQKYYSESETHQQPLPEGI